MPRWRRDGHELFFISEDNGLMAAEVEGNQNEFNVKNVRPLFRVNVVESTDHAGSYDVSADGMRFVINTSSEDNPPPITLVLNWTAALPKR